MKRLIYVTTASFAVFLFLSVNFVQTGTGVLIETKRSALIETLTNAQLESGAFHFFTNITSADYFNEGGTSEAVVILSSLEELSGIDVNRGVAYLASKQDNTSGGFGAFYGYDGTLLGYDLDFTYEVVHALKILDALDHINTTAVANFVLVRHNQSTGAFHELPTEAYGTQYAMSRFPLSGRGSFVPMMYAVPNVISTYLSISILTDLEMLHSINATKTLDWLMSCRADNGAFRPYPTASPTYLPGWPSLITNPFDVDRYGAGMPYTFAAVEALKNLGRLSNLSTYDRNKVKQYILSLQAENGNFYIHPDWDDLQLSYTFYAIITLADIGVLQDTQDALSKTVSHLQQVQKLEVDNSWPVPQSAYKNYEPYRYGSDAYGLFHDTSTDPLDDTFYTVAILNTSGNMAILNQVTARASISLINLVYFSALVALIPTVSVYIAILRTRKKKASVEANP